MNSAMARKLANKKASTFHASKVFRRSDMQDALKKIFMTNADIANCTFLPKSSRNIKESEEITNPVKALKERHGVDMVITHPDIKKHGVFL